MRKTIFKLSSILMLTIGIIPFVFAEDNIPDLANGEKIFNEGKGDAAACMGCHGEHGLGSDDMGAPRLANIGQYYIIKQLGDFAADRRIPDGAGAVMPDFAKALSDKDKRDVAAYLDTLEYTEELSDLKAIAAGGTAVGKPEIGKEIVTHGIKGKVPACQDCHGFNGRASRFPQINQQRFVYLVNQLNNWRSESRKNDPVVDKQGIMRRIAKNLSDDDINNIAAFLSTAPRVAPGGMYTGDKKK